MKRKYLVLGKIGLVLIEIVFVFSFRAWAVGTLIPIFSITYDGPTPVNDKASGIAISQSGNIIVIGKVWNGANNDYFTIKYNNDLSVVLASATYNGIANGNDSVHGITIDQVGNIIITGTSWNGSNFDYCTVKYNNDLSLLLNQAIYDGGDMDSASEVAVDGNGNIFVFGTSYIGTNRDYFTIKYNDDLSVVLASTVYNGPGDHIDWGNAIVVDHEENILVTGACYNGMDNDYYTIKYNNDLSSQLGLVTYNGNGNDYDTAFGITVDQAGNIIVTGRIYNGPGVPITLDYFTIKYDSNFVAIASATYASNPSGGDYAHGVAVDGKGNIIITGRAYNGTNVDYFTIKYDQNLIVIASAAYNGVGNGDDEALGIVIDNNGNIIVTGYSDNGVKFNFFTIKYLGSPTISSIFPLGGNQGETLGLIINGLNFYEGADITFNGTGILVNSVNFISSMEIRANITVASDALSGMRDTTVTNIDEASGMLVSGFEIRENISYQDGENSRFVKLSPKIITPNGDGINDVANFIFTNPNNETVEGMIFDLSGSVVKDGLVQNSDTSLIWDGRDDSGSCVSGKVYMYQIKIGGKVFNGTVVVAK
jgi:hypothetical protein